jgi:acyl-CoA hydrolase
MNKQTAQTFCKHVLVRPHDLNHAGTLFGGTMMAWADEMAFIAATLEYPRCTFVTKVFHEFDFISGTRDGDIIQIEAKVLKTGCSSVTVAVKAINALTNQEIFKTSAVMVNARNGKSASISSSGVAGKEKPSR